MSKKKAMFKIKKKWDLTNRYRHAVTWLALKNPNGLAPYNLLAFMYDIPVTKVYDDVERYRKAQEEN